MKTNIELLKESCDLDEKLLNNIDIFLSNSDLTNVQKERLIELFGNVYTQGFSIGVRLASIVPMSY